LTVLPAIIQNIGPSGQWPEGCGYWTSQLGASVWSALCEIRKGFNERKEFATEDSEGTEKVKSEKAKVKSQREKEPRISRIDADFCSPRIDTNEREEEIINH